MNNVTLTDMEKKVLAALFESSKGNGHDFGFVEDCRKAVDRPDQLGGVIASLAKKGIMTVHGPVTTNQRSRHATTYTQTTWNLEVPEVVALLHAPHAFRFRSNPPETDMHREYDACFICGLPSDDPIHQA